MRRLASLYPKIIQRSRSAWGAIYHASNTKVAFGAVRGVFGSEVREAIRRLLEAQDPDVILSVHPLLNHVSRAAIRRSGRQRGLMIVVTDLLELHRGWAFPDADVLIVPTEEAGETVRRLGVPGDRVRVLGLPVDLRFRPPAPGEKQALRRRWGLDEFRPTVLVLGGGEGSGKLLEQVRALAWGEHEWQVIAVCGRNEKLRRRLARVRFATPTVVLGFVDFMPALMRASDLVVTKAGPGAIAEALATGVPLVITGYLPGQETANVRFVTDAGFGLYAPKPDELQAAVGRLLGGADGAAAADSRNGGAPERPERPASQERPAAHERKGLSAMAERAAAIARPYASLDIARECVSLAERYQRSRTANQRVETEPALPGATTDRGNGRAATRLGGYLRRRLRADSAEVHDYSAASQARR